MGFPAALPDHPSLNFILSDFITAVEEVPRWQAEQKFR
jgi:hypothetical protein